MRTTVARPRMPSIFLNYRTRDGETTASLIDGVLAERFGASEVFRAPRSIPPGADFESSILAAVRGATVLLAVIGDRWLTAVDEDGNRRLDDPADWVRREIAEAFDHGVTVVPLLLGDVRPPMLSELPAGTKRLAKCQYLRLHHRQSAADIRRLITELEVLVPSLPSAGRDPEPDPPRLPSVNNGIVVAGSGTITANALAVGKRAKAVSYGDPGQARC